MPLRGTLNDENRPELLYYTGSTGRLSGRMSYYCGAYEPAYQSGPGGLLRTLNCCHGFGQEHAEQFVRLMHRPPMTDRLPYRMACRTSVKLGEGGLVRAS